MDERTVGVILRTRPLTETSLIVQWLTRDAGRVSTVARGARRAKSPFRGRLDLFFQGELTFKRSRRSELHTLCEISVQQTFPRLRTDWSRLSQAAYGVALIEQMTETDTPLPEVWEVFRGFLAYLNESPTSAITVVALELKLLEVLGLLPDLARETLLRADGESASRLLATDWSELATFPADASALPRLIKFLQGLLTFHFHRIPRGRHEALGK